MRRANSADVSASYHKYVEKNRVSVSNSFNNTFRGAGDLGGARIFSTPPKGDSGFFGGLIYSIPG